MEYKDIIYTKADHIATITLNRPERMNAFTFSMIESIQNALQDAAADSDVRVIVITGAGRAFCAGLDLKETPDFRGGPGSRGAAQAPQMPMIAMSIDKPIIASINGAAIGWGFELALLADIRVCAENAPLGDRHLNYSVIADNGGLFLLPRLIGWARACEMIFTAQTIDGKEAERIGLVNKAVPADQVAVATRELANRIVNEPPLAVQVTKRAMRDSQTSDLKTSQDYAIAMLRLLANTEDFGEAFKAFIEKRPPQFKGR